MDTSNFSDGIDSLLSAPGVVFQGPLVLLKCPTSRSICQAALTRWFSLGQVDQLDSVQAIYPTYQWELTLYA